MESLKDASHIYTVERRAGHAERPGFWIAKALEGDYRSEHGFALKQSLQSYRFYLDMVAAVDSEIRQHLGELPTASGAAAVPPKRTKSRVYQRQHFEPASFDLRTTKRSSANSMTIGRSEWKCASGAKRLRWDSR